MASLRIDISEVKLPDGSEAMVFRTGKNTKVVVPMSLVEQIDDMQDIAFSLLSATAVHNDDLIIVDDVAGMDKDTGVLSNGSPVETH